jgi:hypothetical protein
MSLKQLELTCTEFDNVRVCTLNRHRTHTRILSRKWKVFDASNVCLLHTGQCRGTWNAEGAAKIAKKWPFHVASVALYAFATFSLQHRTAECLALAVSPVTSGLSPQPQISVALAGSRHVAFSFSLLTWGGAARGSVVVKALCYKPEGRGFDTQWGNFLNLPNHSGRTRPWGLLSR